MPNKPQPTGIEDKKQRELMETISKRGIVYVSLLDGHLITEEQYSEFEDWADAVSFSGAERESFIKIDLSITEDSISTTRREAVEQYEVWRQKEAFKLAGVDIKNWKDENFYIDPINDFFNSLAKGNHNE